MEAAGVAAILCLWVVERDWRAATQVNVAESYYPCTVPNSILFLLRVRSKERARRALNDLPPVKLSAARLCRQPHRRKLYKENSEEEEGNGETEKVKKLTSRNIFTQC
jgi:hypothetical protein